MGGIINAPVWRLVSGDLHGLQRILIQSAIHGKILASLKIQHCHVERG
jgi:hypothetical protein